MLNVLQISRNMFNIEYKNDFILKYTNNKYLIK